MRLNFKLSLGARPWPHEDSWNCIAWVMNVFEAALNDDKVLGMAAAPLELARDTAMQYIGEKTAAHGFDTLSNYDADNAPQ